MTRSSKWVLVAALTLACWGAQAAADARVRVQFSGDVGLYADVGEYADDRDENLAALKSVFEGLGARLPAGCSLEVVVTDVNLAGELEWMRSSARRLRVMRDVGWPMIQLSYTLKQGDRVLRQGEERVSDMGYLMSRPMGADTQRLAYEERMLQAWLKDVLAQR